MPATRTPTADRAGHQPLAERGQRRPGPGPGGAGVHVTPDGWPGDELPSRFGDAIDDRIAEILDEMLDERDAERPHRRLPRMLGVFSLLLALGVSILFRHSTLAVCTIWPSIATVCLAVAWPTRPTRPTRGGRPGRTR